MTKAAELCRSSSLKCGVQEAVIKTPSNIDEEFKASLNLDIFDDGNERGAGCYWLFKPYIIYDYILEHCKDGDILIYSDAGIQFINSVYPIIDAMNSDVFLFTNTFRQVEW